LQWTADPSLAFGVVLMGDYFMLHYNGMIFARLDKRFCEDVRPLVALQVDLLAYMRKDDWAVIYRTWSQSTIGSLPAFSLEINVYGPREHADTVGSMLSKRGIFLQNPISGIGDYHYHNPQDLCIEGFHERIHPNPTQSSQGRAVNCLSNDRREGHTQSTDAEIVETILGSLSHNSVLHEIHADNRIKSTLLP